MVIKLSARLMAILAVLLLLGGVARADQHDKLIPFLVNIEGWEAQPAKGMSMVNPQMKMISARRSYGKGDKVIAVSLLVNSGPVQESDLQESSREDNLSRVRTRLVKGFWVKSTYSKTNNSGQVIIRLAHNQDSNSLLLANFSKMDEEEALANLEYLNWASMRGVVASML